MGENRQPPAAGRGLDDAQLLKLMQRGEGSAEAAFQQLHERYAKRLFSFFRRRDLGATVAEDLVQETFVRVYRSSATYDRRAQVENWLFSIAKNVWKNDLRAKAALKRRLDRADSLEELEERGQGASRVVASKASGSAADESTLAHERTRVLFEVAGLLPAKMSQVVQLRLLDRDQGEIAKLLKISVSTVKSQLREARGRMRSPLTRRGLTWP